MTGLDGPRARGESAMDAVRVNLAERAAELLRFLERSVEPPEPLRLRAGVHAGEAVSVCPVLRRA